MEMEHFKTRHIGINASEMGKCLKPSAFPTLMN